MKRGLLLDCDGVLTEIELDGHLRAFNQVWTEEGVPWQWTREEYSAATGVSGGHERLLALADSPEFLRRLGPVGDRSQWMATTSRWHRRKTQILGEEIRRNGVSPRPGVRRLATEAVDAGWRLAVVSSGAYDTVHAIAQQVLGAGLLADAVVVTGRDVTDKKPSPECYLLALDRCGLDAEQAVAVEDNVNGLRAARSAGVSCLVTVTPVSADQDFTAALGVLNGLGQMPDEPTRAHPLSRWRPTDGEVKLADLARLADLANGTADRMHGKMVLR